MTPATLSEWLNHIQQQQDAATSARQKKKSYSHKTDPTLSKQAETILWRRFAQVGERLSIK